MSNPAYGYTNVVEHWAPPGSPDECARTWVIPRVECRRPADFTRAPTPARITKGFLRADYLDIGLAAVHIEQLTGHSAEQILDLAAQPRHPGSQPQRPLPLVPAATRTSL